MTVYLVGPRQRYAAAKERWNQAGHVVMDADSNPGEADAIALLPDWHMGEAWRQTFHAAVRLGFPVYSAETMERCP